MKPSERDKIIEERLGTYRKRMREEHSTPIFCIGIGHDHKSGQWSLCAVEDISQNDLADILEGLVKALRG